MPLSLCHLASVRSSADSAYTLREVYIRQNELKSEVSFIFASKLDQLMVIKYIVSESMNHVFSKDVTASLNGK